MEDGHKLKSILFWIFLTELYCRRGLMSEKNSKNLDFSNYIHTQNFYFTIFQNFEYCAYSISVNPRRFFQLKQSWFIYIYLYIYYYYINRAVFRVFKKPEKKPEARCKKARPARSPKGSSPARPKPDICRPGTSLT